jgi:ABC-type nickel/cobalt efflux system permease component RcnA
MGGLRSLLVVLALLLGIAPALATDPLTGRGATPQSETAAPFASGVVLRLAQAQRRLNDAISAAFREVRDGGSRGAIAAILGLAFLYGVLHAIGPGHGKAVVASYFVANRARWTGGIAMGSLISLIQGATAIVLVGLLAVVLQWRQLDVLNRATLVEFVSYGLIALLGIVMLWRGIAGHRGA